MPHRAAFTSAAAIAILVFGGCRQANGPKTGSILDGATVLPDVSRELDAGAPGDGAMERSADGDLVTVVDGSVDAQPDIAIEARDAGVDAEGDAGGGDRDTPNDAIPDHQDTPQGCVRAGATLFKSLGLPIRLRETAALVVDELNVYVGLDSRIWSIPKSGNLATPIWTGDGDTVMQLVLDDTCLYFTTPEAVRRVPRVGGTADTLAMGLDQATELAVDQSSVYWAEHSSSPAWRGRVAKVAKAGGPLRVLTEAVRALGVAVDGANLYYLVSDGGPSAHGIFKMSPDGGPATTVYGDGIAGRRLRANATHLFALLYNAVVRVDKRSRTSVTFPGRSVGGNSLVLDDSHVYWTVIGTDSGGPDPLEGGRLLKAPQDGGEVVNFANCLTKPTAVGVDASYVYWLQGYTGDVWRAPK